MTCLGSHSLSQGVAPNAPRLLQRRSLAFVLAALLFLMPGLPTAMAASRAAQPAAPAKAPMSIKAGVSKNVKTVTKKTDCATWVVPGKGFFDSCKALQVIVEDLEPLEETEAESPDNDLSVIEFQAPSPSLHVDVPSIFSAEPTDEPALAVRQEEVILFIGQLAQVVSQTIHEQVRNLQPVQAAPIASNPQDTPAQDESVAEPSTAEPIAQAEAPAGTPVEAVPHVEADANTGFTETTQIDQSDRDALAEADQKIASAAPESPTEVIAPTAPAAKGAEDAAPQAYVFLAQATGPAEGTSTSLAPGMQTDKAPQLLPVETLFMAIASAPQLVPPVKALVKPSLQRAQVSTGLASLPKLAKRPRRQPAQSAIQAPKPRFVPGRSLSPRIRPNLPKPMAVGRTLKEPAPRKIVRAKPVSRPFWDQWFSIFSWGAPRKR